MELTLLSHSKKFKRNIIQDHYWYDHRNKIMLHGVGGRMEFVYDAKQRRTLPRVVDHEEWINGNDYDDIVEWVQNNVDALNMSNIHKDGHNVTIEIKAHLLVPILEDLYRHGILSDYNEREYQIELKEEDEIGDRK